MQWTAIGPGFKCRKWALSRDFRVLNAARHLRDSHPGYLSWEDSYAGLGVGSHRSIQVGAIHQRAIFTKTAGRISELAEALLGQHLWARGYFCATGAADEETIKAYIEKQKWEEDDQGFQITAPTEP